ncbi:MAG TPA: FCD domain-containing protein [Amycolatopsis sp.]|nr:FCD domain-containing protein [Amycolatopsis sp.]
MHGPMSPGARSALFAPLDQTGRAETVAARLADAITLGLLADAEQLPSETELANRFGVATVTVREALLALRRRGLIETRRGRGGGSFVRTPARAGRGGFALLRSVSLTELRDIGDHYAAIAGSAARLAAERGSADDIERLELATEDLRAATDTAISRAERLFHLEVAAAAQSPRLTREEARLQSGPGGLLWLPPDDPAAVAAARAAHEDITAAIAAADGETARRRTEEHVLETVGRLVDRHLALLGR